MRKTKLFAFASFLLFVAPAMSGCSTAGGDAINLRVLNWEDYIGDGVVEAFEAHEKELGKNVKVIYDTFDTNETMLSSLKTGKSTYDLICPSDYAIQKMMSQGMLEPFTLDPNDNFHKYGSEYLLHQMDMITADVPGADGGVTSYPISNYARGYMWGTLGILYNPAKVAADKKLDPEQVKYDMGDWSSLWNDQYHLEMSIKDSMRDTYSVGIMKVFEDQILDDLAHSGDFDESLNLIPGKYDDAVTNYNPKLTEIFNRCDDQTVKEVQSVLLSLKNNVFGFEVDSGKDDMVKGLIGINLAWSGDAVYSMNRGENEAGQQIYYSLPRTGGNIWFDGWVMPKSSSLHKEEAEDFVNFLSSPEIAAENMNTIGYSSFIAGDYVLDLVRGWYDPRAYAMYVWHDASKDPDSTWADSAFVTDEDGNLVLRDGTGVHSDTGDDYGPLNMLGSTYEAPTIGGVLSTWEDYLSQASTYNASLPEGAAALSADWTLSDLTYMFRGTLSDEEMAKYPSSLGTTPSTNPYVFYTDAMETVADPSGLGTGEVTVGRQFFAQYPPTTIIPKLSIMKDFGVNNKYVLAMWQTVKANNLPLWGVIVFGLILLGAIFAIGSALLIKHTNKKIRIERRKEVAAYLNKKSK